MRKKALMITLSLSMAVLFLCQPALASPIFDNARFDFEAGDGPWSIAIGDLDGDGALDMAVANYGSHNVSVLSGNGDGTFQRAVDYGVGAVPFAVAIGDLDENGALGLAVANAGSFYCMNNTVSVLINSLLGYPKG
ncbi:MAG: FG-GAP repeat domain-containing protein [Candidatus Hodarchaeota archaeon]